MLHGTKETENRTEINGVQTETTKQNCILMDSEVAATVQIEPGKVKEEPWDEHKTIDDATVTEANEGSLSKQPEALIIGESKLVFTRAIERA